MQMRAPYWASRPAPFPRTFSCRRCNPFMVRAKSRASLQLHCYTILRLAPTPPAPFVFY